MGYYLSDYLVNMEYQVWGTYRSGYGIKPDLAPIDARVEKVVRLEFHEGHLAEQIISAFQPHEIYCLEPVNIEDQIHPDDEGHFAGYDGFIRKLLFFIAQIEPRPAFLHALPELLYGMPDLLPLDEGSCFSEESDWIQPLLKGYRLVKEYRERYHLHAVNCILFGPFSPFQPETAFPRFITAGLCRFATGDQEFLETDDLSVKRDCGSVRDYVRGVCKSVCNTPANDYILATGVSASGEIFIFHAASYLGMTIRFFEGNDGKRRGFLIDIDVSLFTERVGREFLSFVESRLIDPEVHDFLCADKAVVRPVRRGNDHPIFLVGDYSRAKTLLGWTPEYHFTDVLEEMMAADLSRLIPRDVSLLKNE